MFQQTNNEDGVRPLLDVTATATAGSNPLGFRQLTLRRSNQVQKDDTEGEIVLTRSVSWIKPPVSRTASSRSYTAIDVHSEDEEGEIEKRSLLRRIVKEQDSEALARFGGVRAAVSILQLPEPHTQGTENEGLEPYIRGRGFWDFVFPFSKEFWYCSWQFMNSYTILLLIIAAGLCFAVESLQQGVKHGWHDSAVILVVVFLLVFCPSVLSFYRKRANEKEVLKIKSKLEVTVERDETCQMVSVSDVKEGDIIRLKKGDRVPANGLLIEGKNLILDEVINPNVEPVKNPFLISGSVVEYGNGTMIAVSTGADMALSKGMFDLAVRVRPSQETLLQSRMNKLYECMEKFSLGVSLLILLVILTRFICGKRDAYYNNDKPETKGEVTMGVMANVFDRILFLNFGRRVGVSFLATILLTVVIGIQHGVPFAITASLCLWREKIRRLHGGKSQNLSACGTMGLVSAICIDISVDGGLSFHEIEANEFFIGEEKINADMEVHPHILEGFQQAAYVLSFHPMTRVRLEKELLGSWANSRFGMHLLGSSDQMFEIIDHTILSPRMGIGAILKSRAGDVEANLHLHYNGDALTILNMCSEYYDVRGVSHNIENQQRDRFEGVIRDMSTKGLRPIAFACKQTNDQVFVGQGIKLLGFVGLKYSCQELKMTLKDLKDCGVRIILTSEGELSAATAMAVDLGIQCGSNSNDSQVVEGEKFRKIMKSVEPEMEKNKLMESIIVMGKATPEDKLLFLQELKATGYVVAFFGGLTTSDAPTLREADAGVTQENWSTKVSQTASDLIVASPTSLNKIIRCGRCSYLNIQKFYQVHYVAIISGLLITLVCTMFSGKSPITSIHVFWVTLILCLLGSQMMVMELNEEEVKTSVRGNRKEFLRAKVILKKSVIHVLSQAVVFLLLEYLGQRVPLPSMEEDVRHTMIFNTFILWQISHLVCAMGLAAVFKAVLQGPCWFLIFLVGVLTVQVMAIEFAGKLVNGVKLSAVQWAICFFLASLRLTLEWVCKYIFLPLLATLLSHLIASLFCAFDVYIFLREGE